MSVSLSVIIGYPWERGSRREGEWYLRFEWPWRMRGSISSQCCIFLRYMGLFVNKESNESLLTFAVCDRRVFLESFTFLKLMLKMTLKLMLKMNFKYCKLTVGFVPRLANHSMVSRSVQTFKQLFKQKLHFNSLPDQ